MTAPVLAIVGGPNGAGKSTLTRYALAESNAPIIDPDRIARMLNPNDPASVQIEAGRESIRRVAERIEKGQDFVLETTLSGYAPFRNAQLAKSKGFRVEHYFVGVNTISKSIERVAIRVSKGGHDIPLEVIERRFKKTFRNAVQLAKIADSTWFYDNSLANEPPRLVLERHGSHMRFDGLGCRWSFDIYARLRQFDRYRRPKSGD